MRSAEFLNSARPPPFKTKNKMGDFGFGATFGLGALGDIASGISDTLFGGIKARRQWKYQRKQMALQQEYNEKNMAIQQGYNEKNMAMQREAELDAWNRENEYNNPAAVRARYEAAGISPQAALGGGATGAGLATSMDTPSSSNPSSSSPSGGADYSGGSGHSQGILSGAVAVKQLQSLDQQIEESKSRARKNDAETAGINLDNAIKPLIAKGLDLDNQSKEYSNIIKSVQAKWADIMAAKDVAKRDVEIQNLYADLDNAIADKGLKQEERDNLIAMRGLIGAQTATEGARKSNIEAQTVTEGARKENIEANTKTEDALRDAKVSLTSNQAKEVVNEIGLKEALTLNEYDKLVKAITGTQPASSVWSYIDRVIARVDSGRGGYANADELRNKLFKALAKFQRDNQ